MEKMKQKLALLLAVLMVFTMSIPATIFASADDGDINDDVSDVTPDDGEEEPVTEPELAEGNVTNLVDTSTVTGVQGDATIAGFSGEGVANLFDGDPSTKYCANSNSVISEDAPLEITFSLNVDENGEYPVINTYAITAGGDSGKYPQRDFKSWTFEGLDENEEWVVLDSRSNQAFAQDSVKKYYQITDNTTAYASYRLVVTATQGALTIYQVADLDIYTGVLADENDADTQSKAAAAIVMDQINALPSTDAAVDEDLINAVAEAKAAYDALDDAAQAFVTNYSVVTNWEKIIAAASAPAEFSAMANELFDKYSEQISSEDGLDYHLAADVTAALILFNGMSAANQLSVAGDMERLEIVAEALNELTSSYVFTVGGWGSASNASAWINNATDEDQLASQAAAAAAVEYTYKFGGMKVTDGTSANLTAEWGAAMISQLEGGDNVYNPWDQAGRRWGYVAVPYVGIAFVTTGYFSTRYDEGASPISDAFQYSGRTYQQFTNGYAYYDNATIGDKNVGTTMTSFVTSYPGYSGSSDITKNTFRLAYAAYAQANRENYKVLGIPEANAVKGETVIYQPFVGPSGAAYIAAAADDIAAANANAPAAIAHVITGTTLEAIEALNADFAAAIEIAGAPISDEVDGVVQLFQNGYVNEGEFIPYDADNSYMLVNNYMETLAESLDAGITDDSYDAQAALVEKIEAAYATLSDAAKEQVVDGYAESIAAAKAALEKYVADKEAVNDVIALINALPYPVAADDQEQIEAARAAYDALEDALKVQVTNYDTLTYTEGQLQIAIWKKAAAEVVAKIEALPEYSQEAITADNFDAVKAAAQEADDAYQALPAGAQKYVDDDSYNTLVTFALLLDSENYEEWVQNISVKLGDMNNDDSLSVTDVVLLRKAILAGDPDSTTLSRGDMNKDGSLSVTDVVLLRKAILAGD